MAQLWSLGYLTTAHRIFMKISRILSGLFVCGLLSGCAHSHQTASHAGSTASYTTMNPTAILGVDYEPSNAVATRGVSYEPTNAVITSGVDYEPTNAVATPGAHSIVIPITSK
jgi:hypothetical protein